MLAVLVNTGAVLLGSTIGLFFRKGIPERVRSAIMIAIAVCTLYIGISGAINGTNPLVAIVSMVLGAVLGTLLKIDTRFGSLALKIESRLVKRDSASGRFVEGFVTAFLLWCVGAMTITGSLHAGISGDYELLLTKSLLDFISSMMLASSLGLGVLFASVPLFLLQSALVLCAGALGKLLSDDMVHSLTCVGSLLILMLGLNLLGVTKLKVADYLPALLLAPFACILCGLLL